MHAIECASVRWSALSMRHYLSVLLLLAATALADFVPYGASFEAILALEAPAPDLVESYGEAEEQRREFWLHTASDAPRPLVVLIHGGCWLNAYGVEHARALAGALRDEGYVVLAPEYRRVGDAGGGWPGTLDDLRTAVQGALARVDALGVDPERVALVGHSAGGHLALLLALELGAEYPALSTVGLAAITDPERYAFGSGSCHAATPEFFGGMPQARADAYRVGSPLRRIEAAPDTPLTLIHGTRDSIVAPDQAEALAAAGSRVDVRWLVEAAHFDLIHPGGGAFPVLLDALPSVEGPAR